MKNCIYIGQKLTKSITTEEYSINQTMLNRVPTCEDNCLRVFRDVMLYRLVDMYRNSRGNCYLIYQNKFIQFHNEGCNLQVLSEPQMAVVYSRL